MNLNKYIILAIIALTLLVMCKKSEKEDEPSGGQETSLESTDACTVVLIKGEVIFKDEKGSETALTIGDLLFAGYTVITGSESAAELQMGTSTVVRIKQESQLTLDTLFFTNDKENSEMTLELGSILTKSDTLNEESTFEVSTNTISTGIRGTEFSVVVTEDSSNVYVNEGSVAVVKKIEVKNLDAISSEDEETARKIKKSVQQEIIVTPDQKVEVTNADIEKEEKAINEKTKKIEDKLKKGREVTGRELTEIAETIETNIISSITKKERDTYLNEKELKELKVIKKEKLKEEIKIRKEKLDKIRKEVKESMEELDEEVKKLHTDEKLDIENINEEAREKTEKLRKDEDKKIDKEKKRAEDKADNLEKSIEEDKNKSAEEIADEIESEVEGILNKDDKEDPFDNL